MQDFGELLGEGLLLLQMLSGSVRRTGQRLQEALQGILCADRMRKYMKGVLYLKSKQDARCRCVIVRALPSFSEKP